MYDYISDKLKSVLKPNYFSCALATIIAMFLSSGYGLFNQILNHDNAMGLLSEPFPIIRDISFSTGRWMTALIYGFGGDYSNPLIKGSIAILSLAVFSILIVHIFDIEKRWACILTGIAIGSFPAFSCLMLFTHLTDVNFTFLCISVIPALLCKKFRFGFLFGSVILFLCLAVNQALLCITMGLCVAMLLLRLLKGEHIKTVILSGLTYLAMGVIAVTLYLLSIKISSSFVPLFTYRNFNNIGTFELRNLGNDLFQLCKGLIITFFLPREYPRFYQFLVPILLFISVLLTAVIYFVFTAKNQVRKNGNKIGRISLILSLGFVFIFIVACGLVYFFGSGAQQVHTLIGFVLLLVFSIAVFSNPGTLVCSEDSQKPSVKTALVHTLVTRHRKVYDLSVAVLVVSIVLYSFSMIIVSNNIILHNEIAYEKGSEFFAIIQRDIINNPEYSPEKIIIYAGNYSYSPLISGKNPVVLTPSTGIYGNRTMSGVYNPDNYLNIYGTLPNKIEIIQKIESKTVHEVAKQMPVYPSEGAILGIDNFLIIKLSEMDKPISKDSDFYLLY